MKNARARRTATTETAPETTAPETETTAAATLPDTKNRTAFVRAVLAANAEATADDVIAAFAAKGVEVTRVFAHACLSHARAANRGGAPGTKTPRGPTGASAVATTYAALAKIANRLAKVDLTKWERDDTGFVAATAASITNARFNVNEALESLRTLPDTFRPFGARATAPAAARNIETGATIAIRERVRGQYAGTELEGADVRLTVTLVANKRVVATTTDGLRVVLPRGHVALV